MALTRSGPGGVPLPYALPCESGNRRTSAALRQRLPLVVEEHPAGCAVVPVAGIMFPEGITRCSLSGVPVILGVPGPCWDTPLATGGLVPRGGTVSPYKRRGLAPRIMERLHSAWRSGAAEFRTSLPAPAWLSPPHRCRFRRSSIFFRFAVRVLIFNRQRENIQFLAGIWEIIVEEVIIYGESCSVNDFAAIK